MIPNPLRRVAAAVVLQAVRDLDNRDPDIRLDAEQFLTDGRLPLWCELAGIDIHPGIMPENLQPFFTGEVIMPKTARVIQSDNLQFRLTAEDALCLRAGIDLGRPAPGADELAGYSLSELARMALGKAGMSTQGHPLEMVGRALTSSDFPSILANVANKALFEGFSTAEETWDIWCGVGSLPNFLPATLAGISGASDLEEVQLATYGKILALSRQAIINDDLGALTDIPRAYGEAAARKIGDLAYSVLTANAAMGDGAALFASGHSNLAGSGGAVSVNTLGAGIAAMKQQKDSGNTRRLNIRPNFFLGPVGIEAWSEQFFGSNNLNLTTADLEKGQSNPYAGKYFTRIYEPRLDDDSVTAWYLAGPKNKTVKLFFLNGNRKPYMEQQNGWNVDGIEYKVRIDAAAIALDHRGLYKNPGA